MITPLADPFDTLLDLQRALEARTDIRQREHLLSASITIDSAAEIKQLFLEFQAAGVTFHQPLKKEPWGAISGTHERGPHGLILAGQRGREARPHGVVAGVLRRAN